MVQHIAGQYAMQNEYSVKIYSADERRSSLTLPRVSATGVLYDADVEDADACRHLFVIRCEIASGAAAASVYANVQNLKSVCNV